MATNGQPARVGTETARGIVFPEVAAELRRGALRRLPAESPGGWVVLAASGEGTAGFAREVLERGCDLWLAGDGMSIEDERELKRAAHRAGRLVMGPGSRSGFLGGVPLGLSNRVRRGNIGVVGTAGGSIQDALCALDDAGGGVSQALHAGSRDLDDAVGGTMFFDAWEALQADPATEIVLAACRPASAEMRRRMSARFATGPKPTECVFLGDASPDGDIAEAAARAVARHTGKNPAGVRAAFAERDTRLAEEARRAASKLRLPRGRYLRGLFSRGSRCLEAQGVLATSLRHLTSNLPVGETARLADPRAPAKNALLDFGDAALSAGGGHPARDATMRCLLLQELAADPSTAVLLLDVSLGAGSHPDPAALWGPQVKRVTKMCPVVIGLCGTERDEPGRGEVAEALRRAGAHVFTGNGEACRFAGLLTSEVVHAHR